MSSIVIDDFDLLIHFSPERLDNTGLDSLSTVVYRHRYLFFVFEGGIS